MAPIYQVNLQEEKFDLRLQHLLLDDLDMQLIWESENPLTKHGVALNHLRSIRILFRLHL